MERCTELLLISPDPIAGRGLHATLEAGRKEIPCRMLVGESLTPRAVATHSGVILLAPQRWRDLETWLRVVARAPAGASLLLYAPLTLAGLFRRTLEEYPCSLLPLNAGGEEILLAIRRLAEGRALVPPTALRNLFEVAAGGLGHPDLRLERRQLETGCGVAVGVRNTEMAALFDLKPRSVDREVYAFREQLQLPDRSALGRFFTQLGERADRYVLDR